MPLEHKPTALGIPYPLQVSYQFDGAEELLHSLHALFGLLATANTPRYCPQATGFGQQLRAAGGTDSAHILSIALSIVSDDPHWPLPEYLGPAKQDRSRSCLPGSQSPPTCVLELPIKENPAGRAITKLLSSLDLDADQQTLFVRPVGREEAVANTASTVYDKIMLHCTGIIQVVPGQAGGGSFI